MKKILSTVAFLSLALNMSAQVEVCTFDPAAIGITEKKTPLDGGKELGKTTYVTCYSVFTDEVSPTSGENGTDAAYDYAISLDGQLLSLKTGLQGSTNPAAITEDAFASFDPDKGWILRFDVGDIARWGELYVSAKTTGNKNYWVVEESATGERKFIPYWIVTDAQGSGYDNGLQFVTPYDLGVDEDSWSLPTFAAANKQLDKINTNVDHGHVAPGTAKKNGAGLIFFDVLPNRKYYVFGTGTKITSSGFAYSNGALVKEIKALRRDKTLAEENPTTVSEFYLLKSGTIKAAMEANTAEK